MPQHGIKRFDVKRLCEYLPYYRRNLKVALPVMLTQVGGSLAGIFDSMMVGHYGTADLAAVSFSNAIFFTGMVFALGVLMGITPLIGFHRGEEETGLVRDHEIASLAQNGLIFTGLLATAMLIMLGAFIPLLGHFGQDPIVVETARPYYMYIIVSLIPFLLFTYIKQSLEGLGNTTVAMVISVIGNLLNILLNWVFIFGHWGAYPMGAEGAGIATFVSRAVMPLLFVPAIIRHREWHRYLRLFHPSHNSWAQIRRIMTIGLPIGSQSLIELGIFTISFILVGWISKEALAAHTIANQIADLTFMAAMGIGAATTIRISHQLGRGDMYALQMAAKASIHLVLVINTIGAALMISLRHLIPTLFTEDSAVIEIASTLILMAGLFQYADGMQTVGAAMLRGITDVRRPMLYAFIAYIVIGLPISIVCMFPLNMGATGMWVGFIFGLSMAAIFFHTRFHRQMRRLLLNSEIQQNADSQEDEVR